MFNIPQKLRETLKGAKQVLIATHVNPDGDALGSAVGMGCVAARLGSEVRLLLPSKLPEFLSWLPLPAPRIGALSELDGWVPDLLVFVDCGDAGRAGPEFAALLQQSGSGAGREWSAAVTVNIDHHLSNRGFADVNWVEPGSSATGELVGLLAESLDIPLQGTLGEAVYLALSSDTGNFTFANTSASCLAMAGRIVKAGLDIAAFTNNYENNWTLQRMHLWGRLMSEISVHEGGAVALSVVPRAYLDELGLGKASLEGFASWLRRLKGVRVGLFVREDEPNFCKISLRSMGDVDVQAVAAQFGGGGHAAAAGAEIALPPEQAARKFLDALRPQLEHRSMENSAML